MAEELYDHSENDGRTFDGQCSEPVNLLGLHHVGDDVLDAPDSHRRQTTDTDTDTDTAQRYRADADALHQVVVNHFSNDY